jgi:hypothetical protein
MERIKGPEKARDEVRRKERVGDFVDFVLHQADPELAYYCLVLNYPELDEKGKAGLVNVIVVNATSRASEFAVRLLCDRPDLDTRARDALLEHIVEQGDKTSCSLVLTLLPNLGIWERRLRETLSNASMSYKNNPD